MRFRAALSGAIVIALVAAPIAAAGADKARGRDGVSRLVLQRPSGAPGTESAAFTSDNVEWVSVMPQHTGTSGGKKVGKYYYMTDPRGVYIYDIKDPEAPQLVGELPAAQSSTHAALAQEEPDTNGKILLVNAYHPDAASGGATANGWLLVIDVRDKTAPKVAGSLNVYDHMWSCILDCKYAIGRTGYVVDLRDPSKPEVVADWKEHVASPGYLHDFEEVAPGRVIGAGQPSFYLDVRNPLKPKELTRIDSKFPSLGYHGSSWPNGGKDPLLLMGAEVTTSNAGGDCAQEEAHAVATYDASSVIKLDKRQFGPRGSDSTAIWKQRVKTTFGKLQEWRIKGRGAYADGYAPAHVLYCGHWFDPHPDWKAGGVLALAHYDWGTRFLDISRNGNMEEVGYFQPVLGYTGSAKWINDEILYVHDYRRGLDILRFTGSK